MPFKNRVLCNEGSWKIIRKIRKPHYLFVYILTPKKIYIKFCGKNTDIIGKMFEDSLAYKTIMMAKRGLDVASLRNDVIANNIANVNTPGFKRQSVIFEESLRKSRLSAKREHPKHIPFSYESDKPYRIITENDTIYRNDGNNVDLDKEMADLAKNTIYYTAIATRLTRKFALLKLVAQGGR